MSTSRLNGALFAFALAAAPSVVHAQLTASDPSAGVDVASREARYREGPRERVISIDPDGSMWLVANGRRFRTELGTDRVIVIGLGKTSPLTSVDVRLLAAKGARMALGAKATSLASRKRRLAAVAASAVASKMIG